MSRLLKLALFLAVFFVALLIGHQNATAATKANWADVRLDSIATAISGHPVRVYCENDPVAWANGLGPGAWGYTFPPHFNPGLPPEYQNTIWVHPTICALLHGILDNRDSIDWAPAALAIHVLVHESFHQRDGIYGDCTATDQTCEGRTDCAALAFDETAETTLFGYPLTVMVTTNKAVYRWVRRKVRKHWRRVRVVRSVAVQTVTRNPVLDYMHQYQQQNHTDLAKGFPQYGGGC